MTVNYAAYLTDPLAKVQEGQDYVTKLFDQAAQLQSGREYAAGDYQAAAATRAGRGDIAGAQAIQKSGVEQFQAQHEYIRHAAPVFQAALAKEGPQGVARAFQAITPDLKRMGVGDDQIAEWAQRFQSDPQGTIQALSATAAVKYRYEKVGNTLYVFDEANPQKPIGMFEGSQPDKFVVIPAGADLARVPQGTGAATQVPIQQPQAGSGAPLPAAPAGGGAAAAQMPAAPVPVPQPAPQPLAAQPAPQVQRQSVAMAPDPVPPRPGLPPPSAAGLGLPNPEINPAAFGPRAQAVPEGAPAQGVPGSGVEIVARGRERPPTSSGFAGQITPDAVQLAARQYLATGKMPAMGAGGAGVRAQVLSEAARIAKAEGLNIGAILSSQSERAANARSLTDLTLTVNRLENNARAAAQAGQLALSLAPQATGGNAPIINRWIQAGRKALQGDPAVQKFDFAMNTLANEYARVIAGGSGGQQLTDSARTHAYELFSAAQTVGQLRGTVDVMLQEIRIRQEAAKSQLADIRSALGQAAISSGTRQTPAATPRPAAPARTPTVDELLQKYGR